ncbi:response regulator transcription factor [Sulfobacillus harzensis]|uniref:Stage 0 sporulation protein A homolog n=1 Tax=Sulfobacillus harzensis TaxID=2729629 RepID=A0A7Y0Q1J0_9FIRM|nr:response regulator transcription factor [Sulfobacillus harzensis]NMP21512.1 response regulator transcription factor [Sulfobacillus harzensis]
MKILVIEDEPRVADLLARGLQQAQHVADVSHTAEDALMLAADGHYDAAIVDVMLPDMDGFTLIETMRDRGDRFPILMLTARDTVDDKVTGLRSGADDYLTKPFAFQELLARLDALSRRSETFQDTNDITVGPVSRRGNTMYCHGRALDLTPKEFQVLDLLMRNKNTVLSRQQILDRVWSTEADPIANVVDRVIARLRKKLRAADGPAIETARGFGYVIRG